MFGFAALIFVGIFVFDLGAGVFLGFVCGLIVVFLVRILVSLVSFSGFGGWKFGDCCVCFLVCCCYLDILALLVCW